MGCSTSLGTALALVLAGSEIALAGTISGKVELARTPSAVAAAPDISALGASRPPAQPDRRRSVVYLEPAPPGTHALPERPPVVLDQRDEAFQPYVVATTVGSRVEFPNSDKIFHNVFSLSKVKRFDLGRYPRGHSKAVRFDRPGVVRVFCDIHSHMNAFVLVFGHPFFATTDSEGRYRIDAVPPGEHRLVVWNDGEVRATRTLQVGETGTVPADFLLP